MTNLKKNLSRRDAIKLLGAAAGATLLANLPSKWKTPELTSGVLPAHAQTSPLGLTILNGGFVMANPVNVTQEEASSDENVIPQGVGASTFTHYIQISKPIANIPLLLVSSPSGPGTSIWLSPASGPDGEYSTNSSGVISMNLRVATIPSIYFTWTFKNSSDGTDTKTFTFTPGPIP